MNKLQPITADLVRDLRKRGQGLEAAETLQAYRNDILKGKVQVGKEYDRRLYKIKKTIGLCVNLACNYKPRENQVYCQRCYILRENWRKKSKRKYDISPGL